MTMKIQTSITEMLHIDLPVLGAPMFLVSYPQLVAAVSNSGGLGCFPSMNYRTPEELRDAIQITRSLTDKPIGVNIILYREHNPEWKKQLHICLDENVELIITSMGTPRSVVKEARSAGSKVFCDVTTLRQAKLVARGGADALIAVSQGAGGHAGAISPFSLIPLLKKELGLPVLAAGAISGGAQMAAALSLGADAVYMGTRFIASNESGASEQYRDMLIESQPEHIVYTDRISGVPANWLEKSLQKMDLAREEEGGKMTTEVAYKRWKDIWSAGHGVAQITEVLSVSEIIDRMIREYMDIRISLPPVENSL